MTNSDCTGDIICPLRDLLSRLGDKWSVLLIITLAKKPNHKARFGEIKKEIPDISQRMLTSTLRTLERDGLLKRTVFPEVPPRVEYELTTLGVSILKPMEALVEWIESNWGDIRTSRERFDLANKEKETTL
jgi:DNA-binding HxlR family transcriptional regulator